MKHRSSTPSRRLHVAGSNFLVARLRERGERELVDAMKRVTLAQHDPLAGTSSRTQHVYFPLTGVASWILRLSPTAAVGIGTIGNEGTTGVSLMLGADLIETDIRVQIAGDFLRIPMPAFSAALQRSRAMRHVAQQYSRGFFAQATQATACLHFHTIEQRLCRWILMSQDRVGGATIRLTQKLLAIVLGATRPGVTLAARKLQDAGLIEYSRGVIQVLDRRGMERRCCQCYSAINAALERILCHM
jgi:hypothetical protein